MLLALLLSLPAHAGLLSDFCSRYLVADDPYAYEGVDESWISRRIDQLEIASRWRPLSSRDQADLSLLRRELNRRADLSTLVSPAQ